MSLVRRFALHSRAQHSLAVGLGVTLATLGWSERAKAGDPPSGSTLTEQVTLESGGADSQTIQVAASRDRFLVAWRTGTGDAIRAAILDTDGKVVRKAFEVAKCPQLPCSMGPIASDGDQFVLAEVGSNGTSDSIITHTISADGKVAEDSDPLAFAPGVSQYGIGFDGESFVGLWWGDTFHWGVRGDDGSWSTSDLGIDVALRAEVLGSVTCVDKVCAVPTSSRTLLLDKKGLVKKVEDAAVRPVQAWALKSSFLVKTYSTEDDEPRFCTMQPDGTMSDPIGIDETVDDTTSVAAVVAMQRRATDGDTAYEAWALPMSADGHVIGGPITLAQPVKANSSAWKTLPTLPIATGNGAGRFIIAFGEAAGTANASTENAKLYARVLVTKGGTTPDGTDGDGTNSDGADGDTTSDDTNSKKSTSSCSASALASSSSPFAFALLAAAVVIQRRRLKR